YLTVTGTTATLTGLEPMTNYRAWVQKLCTGDSSMFSDGVTFGTTMCDVYQSYFSYDSTWSASTSTYAPMGYSFYNYGFVQTLVDSAQLAGLAGNITAMAFNSVDGTQGSYYTNMDVYLANVPESNLTSWITPDATHQFVQVTHNADLTYTDGGWHLFGLDTSFAWDGHSNLLVTVNRGHGSYASGASFNVHNTSNTRTLYVYQDGSAYSFSNINNYSPYSASYVGDFQFISCGAATTCPAPVVTSVTQDYHSATVVWAGEGTDYEVNIKETLTLDWPATDIAVAGNTYTFSGLAPATSYTVRVRQNCTADSLGYSEWVYAAVVTDSLPCFAPTGLAASNITNATASMSWTPQGSESLWDIHVWFAGGLDSIYRVNTNPATVSGFIAGITYNAAIRAICGIDELEGDWSDTIQFTTATCPDVTGLAASNVTFNSVTLNWNTDAMAQSWIVEYGYHGFTQGAGTTVTVSTNTYVVYDLLDEMAYDFYVKAVCGTDWNSENWASVTATTAEIPAGTYTVTVNVNNPAWGSVTGAGT
ncbi:MAG: fibronectin type III domain-containing protein, partial [Bacteroidales bacterium]|nr:fibronectin type III domain-containing protein [Candidatus Colimorpha merdihippi]